MTDNTISNNPSDVPQQELMLPGFISRRENGVFINLARLFEYGGLGIFVDRLFTGGMLFYKLDYGTFIKLLYDADWLAASQGKRPELKIAENIGYFLPQRQALYREPKVLEDSWLAEYMFEPAYLEEIYEEAVYGEPDENGVAPIVKMVSKTRQIPTRLKFDEFVVGMWLKGVKYGIDADAVRQAIDSNATARLTIARCLEPTTGRDAEILEVRTDLRSDHSPKILASGKADLHTRKNRFPQVGKGANLLKKVPRMLGKPGLDVAGEVIEPEIPKDKDLTKLASIGTYVKQLPDGEYIVSSLDGFLTLDPQTGSVSVVEKIENKAGISTKTTGNLMLDVDEFVEHGEVQEGCVVTGKNMTFFSDVFGKVVSEGGNIFIAGNLSGGSAESQGGNITLGKRVSCAVVRARDGEVTADYCDHTTMVGKVIRVGHVVNCELIADEVYADVVEGCMIAAKKSKIASTGERRDKETLVTMLIPDLSVFDQDIANLNKKIAETQEIAKAKIREIEVLKADAEFAKFLGLHERIKSGAIKLTSDQTVNWRKLMEKNVKMINQLVKLNTEASEINRLLKETEDGLAAILHAREEMGNDISCVIDKVVGQTTAQTMKSNLGIEAFSGMSGNDIRMLLQKVDSLKKRIFSGSTGTISWQFKKPKEA